MKYWTMAYAAVFLASSGAAEELDEAKLAPDPFAKLDEIPVVSDYLLEVDRTRGAFALADEDGIYTEGAHFAKWEWDLEAPRPGNYQVGLVYHSIHPSLGVQVRIGGEVILKTRVPSKKLERSPDALILGKARLSDAGEDSVTMLTSDLSDIPSCQVKSLEFSPAPESEVPGQSGDGIILLEAKSATTYSEKMRFVSGAGNDCLSFWTSDEDWAEWVFNLNEPGEFEVSIFYRCGKGHGGSDVKLLVNEQVLDFTTADTDGSWQELKIGKVKLGISGENKIAILPKTKKGETVMEFQKIVVSPVR